MYTIKYGVESDMNNAVPFRPMIVNRNLNLCHFYRFDDFDASLNDIFTTRHTELDIDEYTPFILRNPTTILVYNVNGVPIHYVNDIVKSIVGGITIRVIHNATVRSVYRYISYVFAVILRNMS